MIWLWILIGFVSAYFVLILILFVWSAVHVKRYGSLQMHCNNCKISFNDVDYNFCPYCGSKLSHHEEYLNYLNRHRLGLKEVEQ